MNLNSLSKANIRRVAIRFGELTVSPRGGSRELGGHWQDIDDGN